MSYQLVAWAMETGVKTAWPGRRKDQGLPPMLRLVLTTICHRAWVETGVAVCSYDQLCDETGISNRSMTRHVAELAAAGLLRLARLRKANGQLAGYAFWPRPDKVNEPWPELLRRLGEGFEIVEDAEYEPAANLACGVNDEPEVIAGQQDHPPNAFAFGGTYKEEQGSLSSYPSDSQKEIPCRTVEPLRRKAPPSRKPKGRFRPSTALVEDRALFPADRRAGMDVLKQQELYDEVVSEVGRERLRRACLAYVKAKGEYVTHFARFLRDDIDNWLPPEIGADEWLKALRCNANDPEWWPERYGPRDKRNVPSAIRLEFERERGGLARTA